jgi:Fe-S-cluster-containing hydrogenase component 2
MPKLEQHPTVQRVRRHAAEAPPESRRALDGALLRQLCLDAGADDVGFVAIDRPEIAEERPYILAAFPQTRTLISFVCRLSREAIRSPARSIGNLEFHRNYHYTNEVAHRIVRALERQGVVALNPSAGFPMEMDHFPGRIWVVSHKPVAVAAGLGRMGIHRNVIHPRFGSFISLATVLVAADIAEHDQGAPIDYNPCLECKLCAATCPVGAISPDGHFNFSACYTHNYREFMGGFTAWVETIADSRSAIALRRQITDAEQASLWQSLSFGANYKAAYCVAVCPAGEEVIPPYLASKRSYVKATVTPLQEKVEPVYVVPGSDAEEHVRKRYPHKLPRTTRGGLRPRTIAGLLDGLPLVFQRGKAKGLDATYHFVFTGAEHMQATVRIKDRAIEVRRSLEGRADITVTADARAWLAFVYKECGLLGMLLSRKLKIKGPPRLLIAFGRCFPN